MKIKTNTLSSAIVYGEHLDGKFFAEMGSNLPDLLQQPIVQAAKLAKTIGSKIQNLGRSVARSARNVWNFVAGWAKEDPVAVVAAGAAITLGGLLFIGVTPVGWLIGGATAIASAVGAASLFTGQSPSQLIAGSFQFVETIYEFNLQQTDQQLIDEIKNSINALYKPAGEFMGRSFAGLLVGGFGNPPRVTINVRQISLMWILHPEIREELLQGVSQLAQQALNAFKVIAFKQAFLQGRAAIKDMWRQSPESIRNLVPGLDRAIQTWGDEGSEPWNMSGWVDKKIESIPDQRIRDAASGFMGGFWSMFKQSVEYRYA